jgi:hypothetical protein
MKRIANDIQDSIRINENAVDSLRNAHLERITPGEAHVVTYLFEKLSTVQSIGKTGAAKALNLLIPEAFVMWDTQIREAYHGFYDVHNKEERENRDASCYASFMRTHDEIASVLLALRMSWKENTRSSLA